MITAVVVNGRVMPMLFKGLPSKPVLPNAISMATPATTGGRIIGSSTIRSIVFKKRELFFANNNANGDPKPTIISMLIPLVNNEIRNACTAVGPVMCWIKSAPPSARIARAIIGNVIKRIYIVAIAKPYGVSTLPVGKI